MVEVERFSEQADFRLAFGQITLITIELVHRVVLQVLGFLTVTGDNDVVGLRHEGIATLLNTTS